MRASRAVGIVVLCSTLVACSESTVVRSYPPGAKLYMNGHFEGLTPIVYTASRGEYSKGVFRARLEREGYAPLEENLRIGVCGGRIAGAIFTVGIVFLFKGPTCFRSPQDFALAPVAAQAQPSEDGGARQPSMEERLRRIERMRDQGTITNEEYERYRKEILKGL